MNKDMTCRDFQFEIGKTYTVNNKKPLELCSDSGFHFCLNLEDVFTFYNYDNCRLFEVETESEVLTGSKKSITKAITITRELTKEDLNEYEFTNNVYNIYFKDLSNEQLAQFKDDRDVVIRKMLLEKMTDLDLMFNTFKDDENWEVRRTVVLKMTDLDLMYKTFKDDVDKEVRRAVVEKMTDLDLIYNTFKDDKSLSVRLTVVNKCRLDF